MRYTVKQFVQLLPVAIMALGGTAAIAVAAKDAITARQGHYHDLGKSFKAINDQLKTSSPDLAAIKADAVIVARIGQQQNREIWFPAGTQAGQGLQTAANALIWKNGADFNAKRADLAKASANFAAVAAQGDITAIRSATTAVGLTCKGCHEVYRDQDKS